MSVYRRIFDKELETLACFIRARIFLEILKLISKLLTVPELLRQKLKPSKNLHTSVSQCKATKLHKSKFSKGFFYFLDRSFIFPEH